MEFAKNLADAQMEESFEKLLGEMDRYMIGSPLDITIRDSFYL